MFQFESFLALPFHHGITTKDGGVSKAPYEYMNTNFFSNDNREDVMKNIKIAIDSLQMSAKIIVATRQVHGVNILNITNDLDESILKQISTAGTALQDYKVLVARGYDGLMTKRDDVILMTFYADCVPILLYDSEQGVIMALHSGWRGTQQRFVEKAIDDLSGAYGSKCHKLMVGIGQSAGVCCYEIDQPVADAFRAQFADETLQNILIKKVQAKYHIDLKKLNESMLLKKGVKSENIKIHAACTICHPMAYHSHRYHHGGPRGSMSAFMQIKKQL